MNSALPIIRSSDLEIMLLVQSKSKKGAELLYDSYAKILFLSISRIIQDRGIAELVFQAVFKKIWSSINEYVIKSEPFYTWIISIAKTMALEALPNSQNYGRETQKF